MNFNDGEIYSRTHVLKDFYINIFIMEFIMMMAFAYKQFSYLGNLLHSRLCNFNRNNSFNYRINLIKCFLHV